MVEFNHWPKHRVYIWTKKSLPQKEISGSGIWSRLSRCYSQLSWSVDRGTRPVLGCATRRLPFRAPPPIFPRAPRVDGPRSPHFARHTRRCATRLFAEALKSRGELRKNKLFRPAGEIIHCTPSSVANVFYSSFTFTLDKSRVQVSSMSRFLSEIFFYKI